MTPDNKLESILNELGFTQKEADAFTESIRWATQSISDDTINLKEKFTEIVNEVFDNEI